MKNKIAYEQVQISITAGSRTFEQKHTFKHRGNAVRVVLAINSTVPIEALRIGVDDTSGTEILEQLHFKLFERRNGGSYYEAMMPVDFDTTRDITVTADAPVVLAADFSADLVFFIENPVSVGLPRC